VALDIHPPKPPTKLYGRWRVQEKGENREQDNAVQRDLEIMRTRLHDRGMKRFVAHMAWDELTRSSRGLKCREFRDEES
jgi:hypothetical protein